MPSSAPDVFTCRPCRKHYSLQELDGRRSCPKCRGPLFSTSQIEGYRANTQSVLNKHQKHSALATMGGSALMMFTQLPAFLQHEHQDSRWLAIFFIAAAAIALVLASLWWQFTRRILFVLGILAFQIPALFSAGFSSETLGPVLMTHNLVPLFGVLNLCIMVYLMASFYAWHQFASYCKVASQKGL